ncbi:MAG: HPF/RaiA family ribosome-associated protein [Ignavibacteriaceae bacterium]
MKILFNTDKNVSGNQAIRSSMIDIISEDLSRFDDNITRLEVHLSDENGKKSGQTDKRCVIEARLQGMHPIAVTNHADSPELAVTGAVDKLKSSIDKIKGRMRTY